MESVCCDAIRQRVSQYPLTVLLYGCLELRVWGLLQRILKLLGVGDGGGRCARVCACARVRVCVKGAGACMRTRKTRARGRSAARALLDFVSIEIASCRRSISDSSSLYGLSSRCCAIAAHGGRARRRRPGSVSCRARARVQGGAAERGGRRRMAPEAVLRGGATDR